MRKTGLAGAAVILVFFISGCNNFHDDILKNDVKRFAYLQDTSSVKKRYTRNDWTPLMSAASVNDLALAKALIKMPAYLDINALDKKGQSAIYISAINKNYDVFKYLVHVGAELDSKTHEEIKKDETLKKIASEREMYSSLNENSGFRIFMKFFSNYPKGYYSSDAFDKFLPLLQAKIAQIGKNGSLKEIDGFIKETKQLRRLLKSKNYINVKEELRPLIRKEYILHTKAEFNKIYKNLSSEKLEKFLSETIFTEDTVEIKEKAELLLVDIILKEAQMNLDGTLSPSQQNKSLNNLEKLIKKYEGLQDADTKEQVVIFRRLYKNIILKSI